MLTAKMAQKLNDQVTLEAFSSNLYLHMSAWCLDKGLEGCGAFLREHADEERQHMIRLFDYINEAGARAVVSAIEAPTDDFTDVRSVFEATYEHEQLVTHAINQLVATAFEVHDFSTFNFLQWYVAEQHEEENLFKAILDKADLIGLEGRGLYHFDAEVRKLLTAGAAESTPVE